MGRRSTFSDDDVFAAVGRMLVRDGEVRMQSVVEETGVSVGSLYHRFGSREGLLARAWLDTLGAFHARFLAALDQPGEVPGLAAALETPRFCRAEPDKALILVCCRRSELMSDNTPEALQAELAAANDRVMVAIDAFCRHTGLPLEIARLGLIGFPLGAVKLYLPGEPVPEALDAEIERAYRAVVLPRLASS
ncbi:TetR/AcrR family transcriptional regulator [Maricaulis sp.]|uniref:TetR/AcrR family transcriptional regulator n=1 Tax=Maricaulis sp. TaxID=1486257 RepID=UPI001B20F496|nr:TetR/AcrR family transcriptional regulator [Maricaulis sp.]MBO6763923.1 TetR/AcrR family transcriptional regulator [Maricaulis sp.]